MHDDASHIFKALKNQSGLGQPSEISRGQILNSFFTTQGYPPNLLGVSANKKYD